MNPSQTPSPSFHRIRDIKSGMSSLDPLCCPRASCSSALGPPFLRTSPQLHPKAAQRSLRLPIERATLRQPSHPSPAVRTKRTSSSRNCNGSLWRFTLVTLLSVCLLASCLPAALASQGDRSFEYKHCVESCERDSCGPDPNWDDGVAHTTHLPLILRAMGWTCPDDCRYHCTHRVTNDAFDRVNHIKSEAQQAVQALASIAASDGSQGFGGMSRAAQKQKYEELVESRLKQLSPVQKQMVQYHGKWVFIRFLGAQEPLSVIFSLLNLWVHSKGVVQLRSQLPDLFPLKVIYILHALVSCNAWIWSAVFHARDKGWTEKLDYFSAGAVILSGLFFSICRLFRIPPSHPNFTLLARVCAGALAVHILYLSIGRFDYSYNMTANVLVGLAHTLLWLAYSLRPSAFPGPNDGVSSSARSAANGRANELPPNALSGNASSPTPILSTIPPPSSSRTARIRLQLVVGLLVAATSLELLDFPPILRALDAHALWHLATVPLASMWYKWLIDDARECTSSGWWVGRGLRDPSIDVAPHVVEAMEKAKVWAVKAAATTQQGHAVGTELVARIRGFGERNLSATFGSAVGAGASPSERELEKAKEMGGRSHGGISV